MMLKGPGPHQGMFRHVAFAAAAAGLMLAPASAQVRNVDPNTAIDADLVPGAPASSAATPNTPPAAPTDAPPPPPPAAPVSTPAPATAPATTTALCTGT